MAVLESALHARELSPLGNWGRENGKSVPSLYNFVFAYAVCGCFLWKEGRKGLHKGNHYLVVVPLCLFTIFLIFLLCLKAVKASEIRFSLTFFCFNLDAYCDGSFGFLVMKIPLHPSAMHYCFVNVVALKIIKLQNQYKISPRYKVLQKYLQP